jgi:Collagenase and related proteases
MNNNQTKKKCELLVPAGGVKQFIAAVENGADAVYIGGHIFNAQNNAENFNDEEMQHAIDFAHKRGVKVYVTMNTLIGNDELDEAVKYAAFLYETGADALMIQDLGLGKLIHEWMPELSLHLSAQVMVCNLAGVETAARLGYDRVAIASELNLLEIKEICENTETEIEMLVHGELCKCCSGQCQLSRYFGGQSGNRGQCAQPCRLPYKSFDADGRLLETLKHPLKPQDICRIDQLGELIEAGVTSLKVEGSEKSADYVAIITSIYRKHIDMYYKEGNYAVSEEDWQELKQMQQGIKIGKVIKKIQGTALVDVKLYDKLELGDGIEIQGRERCGNVVTYYKELKGGLTRIGNIKGRMYHGDPLYRITSKEQLTRARSTYENVTFEDGKYLRKVSVDMLFTLENGIASLSVTAKDGTTVTVNGGAFEKNDDNATDKQRIEDALRKTGNTPFAVNEVRFDGTYDRRIKVAAVNDIRRNALAALEKSMVFRREKIIGAGYQPLNENKNLAAVELFYFDWDTFAAGNVPMGIEDIDVDVVSVVPVVEFEKHYTEIPEGSKIIPYISNISKGAEDIFIEDNFDSIVLHCMERGIYVGNLSWIQPLRSAGITVFGDYGLNVYNEESVAALDAIGVHRCIYSLESMDSRMGSFPIMTLEHDPEAASLIHPNKERLRFLKRRFSDQTLLISGHEIIELESIADTINTGSEAIRIFVER